MTAGLLPAHGQGDRAQDGQFIAFSLNQARDQILGGAERTGDLFELGGITQLAGFVVDDSTGDLIIVGKVFREDEPLTLDDLVIALRSRIVLDQWPLVSIDMNEDRMETEI